MKKQLEYVIIIHEADEGGYWSEVPSLPGAGSQGESLDEVTRNTRESIEAVIHVMRERGEPVSAPRDLVVTVQVAA
jgi:predicted RNase H-like HicB family nuclease